MFSTVIAHVDLLSLCSVSLQLSVTEDMYGLLFSNLIHCIYFCILLKSIVFHILCNEYDFIYMIICGGYIYIYVCVPFKKWFRMQFETENTRIKNGHIEISPSQHRVLSWFFFFMSLKVTLIFNIVFLFTFLWCFWSSVSKLLTF